MRTKSRCLMCIVEAIAKVNQNIEIFVGVNFNWLVTPERKLGVNI